MTSELRFEFKYMMNLVDAQRAEEFIRFSGMHPDPKARGDGAYTVTSVYFDSAAGSDYYDKSGGFIRRKKVRARVYAPEFSFEEKDVWLEIKEKYDAMTRKTRFLFTDELWKKFLLGGPHAFWRFVPDDGREIITPFIREIAGKGRIPKLLVRYSRRPYLARFRGDTIRITFDSNLETSHLGCARSIAKSETGDYHMWHPQGWIPVSPNKTIMEVKFTKYLPGWFGELVRHFALERTSISKYSRSFEVARFYETVPR